MSLETIYYIGQTLAVLAVLISLIAVFFQLRQQSQTARSELYLTAVTAFAEIFRTVRTNPEFARLYSVFLQEWDALSKIQKLQIHAFNIEMCVNLDSSLTMYEQKMIDESTVIPWIDNLLGVIITPGGAKWWNESQFFFTPQLRDTLNDRLLEPESLPPPWTHFSPWLADHADIDELTGGNENS